MGKGDKRTRRGKIWRGTTGNKRPKGVKKGDQPEAAPKVIKKSSK